MSDKYTCSDASAARGESMFATGSQVRGWLLIEVRGAWGEDAIHTSAFGDHVPKHWKDQLKRRQIRAVCIRSHARAETTGVRIFACAARRPGEGSAPLWTRDVDLLADVATAAEELRIDRSPPSPWKRVDDKLILVCTNGRHDQCCANLGRPLVRALNSSSWADRVWECSHIGGDRFAANVVILPDSLYFGRVDATSASDVLAAVDDGRIMLSHFRGRTSLTIEQQAVEHFVRHETGHDTIDGIVIENRAADGSFSVRLDDRAFTVRVQRRLVSVDDPLTCKGKPGQLVPRFTLQSITRPID